MYEIREPIHQTISFSEDEAKVIDHPIFQRMRHIRQLGMSFLVYPGSTHDRFSHMLGAMHLAGRVWDNIIKVSGDTLAEGGYSEEELRYYRQVLRYAALLHDIGHAPFSHVSENARLMPKFGTLEAPKEWYAEYDPERTAEHEDYSVMLIAALGKEGGLPIGEEMAQDIASLIHSEIRHSDGWRKRAEGKQGNMHAFLKSLISGELDVDRMDYLLRDAHFTGVAYGVYDKDHLIRNLGVVLKDGNFYLTIDSTSVRAFEDFLLARYHMFLQVYHHKTTNGFDYFLRRAFADGEVHVTIPGTVEGYMDLRDSTFTEALFAAAKNEKHHWSRRFVHRRPAKRVFAATGAEPESRETMRKLRKALESEAVDYFTINSHQYISKLDTRKPNKRNQAVMLVREKRLGKVMYTPVERYSALLKKYNEAIDIVNLYVLPEYYEAAVEAIKKHKV